MNKLIEQLSNTNNLLILKYYLFHPIVLIRNRLIILILKIKKIIGKDINFHKEVNSNIPIDIVLCAIDKDYDVLIHVIDSIRKYIKHPIGKIFLICPPSNKIELIAKEKKCVFIDENSVLPITKKDINYTVMGQNRSGWLFQQLLKWSADKFVTNEYFLITEADTIYCRPQVFIDGNRVLLPVSNQLCHLPYFSVIKKLLGLEIKPLINLTSHHSLFENKKLKVLKQSIEKKLNVPWWQGIINSIDHTQGSSVSDYETYGQFVYAKFKNQFKLEYWYNLSLGRYKLAEVDTVLKKYSKKFKNISFHSYNE